MKRRLVPVLILISALGFAAWRYGYESPGEGAGTLSLYGNVDIRQVDLGFRVGGRIAAMRVEEGVRVSAGNVLAVLDKTPFENNVRLAAAEVAAQRAVVQKYEAGSRPEKIAQALALVTERQAALVNASINLKRQRTLVEKGNVSQQIHDDAKARTIMAKARLQSARDALALLRKGFRIEDIETAKAKLAMTQARLAIAQTALSDSELTAPNDGIIISRIEEPGAIVNVGAPAYTLSLSKPVWVRAYVSEPDLGRIRPGMKARVFTDSAPESAYKAHIGFISPVAEFTPKSVETASLRTDLVYRLRVIVDDPAQGLRQGMPVTVRIDTAAPEKAARK